MCGFIVSQRSVCDERFIRRRGPDLRRAIKVGNFYFTHFLLSITGEFTPQPFVDGDVVCVYNGEIYSPSFGASDGDVLIPLYRSIGVDFAAHLDGEFAIALFDFAVGHAVLATDPIGTKPLWRSGTEVASYKSPLGKSAERVEPNMRIVKSLITGEEDIATLRPFDFDHQEVDTYDRWIESFETAVAKRAKNNSFLCLSSGYDSGAIDCVLRQLDTDYECYSIEGKEDLDILRQRNGHGTLLQMTPSVKEKMRLLIETYAEPYDYRITYHGQWRHENMFQDNAIYGLAWIYSIASAAGRRVCYSGQGADEIFADYGRWGWATELGGCFPRKLTKWRNFDGDRQRAYLTKEEYVAGAFGIEARYPFLDFHVIQEFLWLTTDLKNRHYKAPLHELLERYEYPFKSNHKQGFEI